MNFQVLTPDNTGVENAIQFLVVRINERPEGEAYVKFKSNYSAQQTARKLRELADTIENAANG
jgi:hypothetical protein